MVTQVQEGEIASARIAVKRGTRPRTALIHLVTKAEVHGAPRPKRNRDSVAAPTAGQLG